MYKIYNIKQISNLYVSIITGYFTCYILYFIFYYVISIKKCKRDLVILRHCQLYIKVLLR
jgi:phosphotransferase system  glucose/maltose/N-acetylglucosamine-specific IIC component